MLTVFPPIALSPIVTVTDGCVCNSSSWTESLTKYISNFSSYESLKWLSTTSQTSLGSDMSITVESMFAEMAGCDRVAVEMPPRLVVMLCIPTTILSSELLFKLKETRSGSDLDLSTPPRTKLPGAFR